MKNNASADLGDEQHRRDEVREREIYDRFSLLRRDPDGQSHEAVGDLLIAGYYYYHNAVYNNLCGRNQVGQFWSPLYKQERVGLNGRRFMLLKFRSMVVDAESDGRPVWAAERDARITRVGRFIRRARIDELPQLFNVLCGDMSMVGRTKNL